MTKQAFLRGIKAAFKGFSRTVRNLPLADNQISAQKIDGLLNNASPLSGLMTKPTKTTCGNQNLSVENDSETPVESNWDEFSQLQAAANYQLFENRQRLNGVVSIFWGIVNTFVGINAANEYSTNIVLVFIGVPQAIMGIWFVFSPKLKGIVFDGVSLIVIGVWNLVIAGINASHGREPEYSLTLGILQILWAGQRFRAYDRFSRKSLSEPTPPISEKLDAIADYMKTANMTTDSHIVEFRTESWSSKANWKGRLGDGGAVFFVRQDLIFVSKQGVSFKNHGKAFLKKSLTVTFALEKESRIATISPEAFQRYEAWKGVDAVQAAPVDLVRYFHVLVAIVLPFIGLPWGIINLFRRRVSSGLVMTIISGVILGAIIVIRLFNEFNH